MNGDPLVRAAEERVGGLLERLGGRDPQVQQPRQRQVDVGDLVEVEPVVEAAERRRGPAAAERQRRGARSCDHSSRSKVR